MNSDQHTYYFFFSSMSMSSVYVCIMFSSFRSIYLFILLTLFSTFAFDFNVFIGLRNHSGIYLQYPFEHDVRYCTILGTRLRTYFYINCISHMLYSIRIGAELGVIWIPIQIQMFVVLNFVSCVLVCVVAMNPKHKHALILYGQMGNNIILLDWGWLFIIGYVLPLRLKETH